MDRFTTDDWARRAPSAKEAKGRMAPQYIFTMKDLRKVTPQG